MQDSRLPPPISSPLPTSLKRTLRGVSQAAPSTSPKAGLQGRWSGCGAPPALGSLALGGWPGQVHTGPTFH